MKEEVDRLGMDEEALKLRRFFIATMMQEFLHRHSRTMDTVRDRRLQERILVLCDGIKSLYNQIKQNLSLRDELHQGARDFLSFRRRCWQEWRGEESDTGSGRSGSTHGGRRSESGYRRLTFEEREMRRRDRTHFLADLALLDLGEDFTDQELRKNYKKLARKHHSDSTGKDGDNEIIIKLNAARDFLTKLLNARKFFDLGSAYSLEDIERIYSVKKEDRVDDEADYEERLNIALAVLKTTI